MSNNIKNKRRPVVSVKAPDLKKSEGGQISIFVALIFQVLFVIFAMTINIGLLVHDKINLQNSVDLAAYYAAQRQAEILNAIAHHNYQIRQSWKLLAFRIRVLGDSGRQTHPMQGGINNSESPLNLNVTAGVDYPSVCWTHSRWREKHWFTTSPPAGGSSVCYNPSAVQVPPLPSTQDFTGPLFPFNAIIQNITQNLSANFTNECEFAGPSNFLLAANWIAQYKIDIAEKKQRIRELADRLSSGVDDFRDLSGESVLTGVRNTFRNNLTRSNRDSIPAPEIRMFNSMGVIPDRRLWLNEVKVVPYVFYSDFRSVSGCVAIRKLANDPNNGTPENAGISAQFAGAINEMKSIIYETADPENLYQSISGVEKNPWVLAYVGVVAKTTPRKPFAPFGSPVSLTARAFAQPFGGRVGPWMFNQWPRDSLTSEGRYDDRIDPLLSPIPGVPIGPAAANDFVVPNYSRWPGDRLGLRSNRGLSVFYVAPTTKFSWRHYFTDTSLIGPNGFDPLAFDFSGGNSAEFIRRMETAAVAPDVFDITYYSIDPSFFNNYSQNFVGSQPARYNFDFGPQPRSPNSVITQIGVASGFFGPRAPWVVEDYAATLTGWVPNNTNDYSALDPASFGRCETSGNIPGSCAVGGRTGYSVKIVSLDYLLSSLPLGNDGDEGKIKNPPPDAFIN